MPSYIVPQDDRDFLEAYCRDDLTRTSISRERQTQRRQLLNRHAMAFTLEELRARHPGSTVVDANTIKMNNPGYDILIDDRIRIQVKGRCWKEMIDFAIPALEKEKAWQSDFWIAVDFAGLINGCFGRYANTTEMAPNGQIDPYTLPTAFLRKIAEDGFATSKRPRIRAIKPGSQYSKRHHMPELFRFKGNWSITGA